MNVIRQTNRTLLLEEINPEKLDLLTLIGDVKGIESICLLYKGFFTCLVSVGSREAMEAELLLSGCSETVHSLLEHKAV